MLAEEVRPEEARSVSPQRPSVRVRLLPQELHQQDGPEQAPAIPQGGGGGGRGSGGGRGGHRGLTACCVSLEQGEAFFPELTIFNVYIC